jgi:protein SCO1/2
LAVLATSPAAAHGDAASPPHAATFDEDQALAYSQAALGRTVGDVVLKNRRGELVRLAELRGKPVVVSFIYTSCVHTCPIITSTLADAAEVGYEALGAGSFTVLTVGFDTRHDNPARMNLYAAKHGLARTADWMFLSADRATIDHLARDLGFIYFPSAKGFDHLAQTTIIDSGGTVYRQVYGETIDVPLFVDPLKKLVFGTAEMFSSVEELVKGVRLYCTIYDPAAGRYRFDYSLFIQMGVGFLVIMGVITFLVLELRRGRRRRRAGPGRTPA